MLSVVRSLQQASDPGQWRHSVWVHQDYRETRSPPLDYRRSASVLADSPRHLDLVRRMFPAARELAALLGREPFDILHAHSRGALLVALLHARRTGRSVLFTNHNYARRKGFYRWVARRPSIRTVLLTPAMARHYRLEDQTEIVSACFDDRLLEGETASASPGTPFRICGAGSVIGWKKWDLLVEAIGRLPASLKESMECRIFGPVLDPAFKARVEAAIAQRGLSERVRLCGPSPDMRASLLESDLFVLPSTNEPCSVALMEALALGLPAIVSRSGGSTDIVAGGCGLFFDPDSAASLKDCLERALRGEARFLPPQEIRRSVARRSATQVLREYSRIWREMTGR